MKLVEYLLSIPLLIQLYTEKYYQEDYSKTTTEMAAEFNVPKIKVYDFIIVGGGTAGCILARRLSSETPFSKVLLLEAGGTPPPAATVPYFTEQIGKERRINYIYKTVPMTNANLKNGGIVITHTGKMLGGSGSHNDMNHNRGSPKDYDNWAKITQDNSWSYANVLQYFKKSENFIGKRFRDDNFTEFYGMGGPITVDTYAAPLLPLWFEAGHELGYEQGDPNGFQREGFFPINKAIYQGRRMSSFSGYIEKWENDPLNSDRLTIIRYANVSEILLNSEKRAYGVVFTRHGFPQIAHASKEVIISAGAYSSPLLLLKSGIGPKESLRKAKIPIKVQIESVGKNLNQHPALMLGPFRVNDSSLFPRLYSNEMDSLMEDYHKGLGVLANKFQGPQCFIVSSKAEKGWPNLWIAIHPQVMIDDEPQEIRFDIVLGRPKSTGRLILNTNAYRQGVRDDTQLALMDFKLLAHPEDVDAMLEGIKFTLKMVETTTAFKRIDMKYAANHDQACSNHVFRSDDYWKCVLRQNVVAWIHTTGTCSMGPESDSPDDSVVDSKFRVRGVTNLRVVDASIIPVITNAGINAPVIMIAEKAADEIRKTWYSKSNWERDNTESYVEQE